MNAKIVLQNKKTGKYYIIINENRKGVAKAIVANINTMKLGKRKYLLTKEKLEQYSTVYDCAIIGRIYRMLEVRIESILKI